jgi:hypothetical protein
MSNWSIKEQEQNVKGDVQIVKVKVLKWRPASAKEREVNENATFKRMKATYCMLLSHAAEPDNCLKITVQFRKGGVDRSIKQEDGSYKHFLFAPVFAEADQPALKAVKDSTGGKPWDIFWNITLPERIRDAAFRKEIFDTLTQALPQNGVEDEAMAA